MYRNCFLKHVIEEKIEGENEIVGRFGRARKQLLDDFKETKSIPEIEKGITRSHSEKNWHWKRLGRKTDC